MSRPWIVVHLDGYSSRVEGEWPAKQLLLEVAGGRKPMRAARGVAGWVVQETTARRVISVANARNFDLDVVEPSSRKARLWKALVAAPAPVTGGTPQATERADGVLW